MSGRRRVSSSPEDPSRSEVDRAPSAGLDLDRRLPTDARWADRLRLEERSRRLVPSLIAVAWVRSRAARRWRRDSELREDMRHRALLVSPMPATSAERDRLARGTLLEDATADELLLRPWLLTRRRRLCDSDHLRRAIAEGRGVLVSYCHLGPFPAASNAVVRVSDRRPWLFLGTWIDQPPQAGETGRHVERWRNLTRRAGPHALPTAPGTAERAEALLRKGEVVCFLFDVPGATETPWLGKTVALASGTARIAHAADALVVPMHSRRVRGAAVTTFHPAVDPRDHLTPESLHLTLAAVHERLITAQLHAFPDPRRTGAWEHGAGRERWAHPHETCGER